MLKKIIHGLITLIIGIICLIGTIILYNNSTIDDVFMVILMTFSIMILVYGIFQIIRDSLQQ